jgi:predicted AAA+ superfamily ATPase
MIDSIKGITIIVTGSRSFDLVSHAGEPLVGRNIVYHLYPVGQSELSAIEDYLTTQRNLEQRLIYGSYPELWHLDNQLEQENYLKKLVNSYLMKDILIYESIKGSDV